MQSDALLLADVFGSFANKYIIIYVLDPEYFLSAPGLTWQVYMKKTKFN